jgi:hypothetical protein
LIGAGKDNTNRDAVGAKVQVRFFDSGKSIWRFINGSSGSYSNPSRVIQFGLGQSSAIEVTVIWPPSKRHPQGHQQTFQLGQGDLNRIQVVKEF